MSTDQIAGVSAMGKLRGERVKARETATDRLRATLRGGGLFYTAVYGVRWGLDQAMGFLERRLVAIEQKRHLVEPWTISARRRTVADNKRLWNTYDWSRRGEEWTMDAGWKARLIDLYLIPNIPEGGTILEIGPGGGRWTEVLQNRAAQLHVVDVSERAIELCRERFVNFSNIEYSVGDGSTIPLPEASIDAVWSYDVFVHIDPISVRGYFQEFRRILRPGGRAVIHHAGPPLPGYRDRPGWRSDLTDEMVRKFALDSGLNLVCQSTELVADKNPGDVLSILERPAS